MTNSKKIRDVSTIEEMSTDELQATILENNREITALRSCIDEIISTLTDKGIITKSAAPGFPNQGNFTNKAAQDVYQT